MANGLLDVAPLSLLASSGTAGTFPSVQSAYARVPEELSAPPTEPPRSSRRVGYGGGPPATGETQGFIDPEVEVNRTTQSALAAVEDLRLWLRASYDEVARIMDRSPSLIFHWKRRAAEGSEVRPRRSSVGRLYEVHALVRSVAVALDGTEGVRGVQHWAQSKGPDGRTPLELLLEGQLEAVQARARRIVFDQRRAPTPAWRLVRPEADHDLSETSQPLMRFETDDFE